MRRKGPIFDRIREAAGDLHLSEFLIGFRYGLYLEQTALAKGVPTWMYAIHDCGAAAVKIGTAQDPVKRLRELQTGNPALLVLLGACHANLGLERRFQEALRPWLLRGEWFRESVEVLALVELILAGEDVARDADSWDDRDSWLTADMTLAHLTWDIEEALMRSVA